MPRSLCQRLQRRVRRSAAWLALLLAPLPAPAAVITGQVLDATDGVPLHYATVLLVGTSQGTFTNASGQFVLTAVAATVCTLAVKHVGYTYWSDTLTVADGSVINRAIRLRPMVIELQETTTVTADRVTAAPGPSPGLVEVDAPALRQLPAVGEPDLLRSLELLPGVQTASDISSGLYIRGGGPDQTRILLDQVPVYNPSHAFGLFSTFNPDVAKEVALYKGVYPAAYGANLGAVLDVSSRDGNYDGAAGMAGISLVTGRILVEGPVGNRGRGAWMAAARRTYLDPVLAALRAAGQDVPSYYFYDANAKVAFAPDPSTFVAAAIFGSRDRLTYDSDQETAFGQRWGNYTTSARVERLFSPTLSGRLRAATSAYTSHTHANVFATPVGFANSVRDYSLQADLDWAARTQHRLAAGARATRYSIGYTSAFNQVEQVSITPTPYLLGVYVEDAWQPGALTSARLGLRGEYYSPGGRFAAMPRLTVQRMVQPGWRLELGAGSYRQYLQLVSTEGFSGADFLLPVDRRTAPGRAVQTTAGLHWEPSPRYHLAAEAYHSRMRDLVELNEDAAADDPGEATADIFRTDGRGRAYGLELFAEKRAGRTRGWLGYTLGKTRRRFAEVNDGRSYYPKYDRRHDLTAVASRRQGAWTWGATFTWATGQAYTPAAARYSLRDPATGVVEDYVLPAARNSARLRPYHRLDVSARRNLHWWGLEGQAYLQVFNAYSRRNEWFIQYDTDSPVAEARVVRMLPVVPTFGLDFAF
jgi:hypothetical protein